MVLSFLIGLTLSFVVVTAIIRSSLTGTKEQPIVKHLYANDDSPRWEATLKVTHDYHIPMNTKYRCRIKLVDTQGDFKKLSDTVYGINVDHALELAERELPEMIRHAYERAEAPYTMIVRL